MYFFEYSKSGNCLGVKKVEDLVYIYIYSWLFWGLVGLDLIWWYDENVYLVEFDLDGSFFLNMEDEGLDLNNEGYNWLGGDWENFVGNNNFILFVNRFVRDNLVNNEDNGGVLDDYFYNVYGDFVDFFVFNEVDIKLILSVMELLNDNYV